MPDQLRTEANERIDLADWEHATFTVPDNAQRWVAEQMLTDPVGAIRTWILSGFTPSWVGVGQQIEVTRGVALLARRDAGVTKYGALAAEGDTSRIVDITAFAIATYGIYVRFEYVDGASQNRIFWNPSGLGTEFAQNIATRRTANWSVRIELTSPGSEWTKIGEVQRTGGAPVVTDQRHLYFEGQVSASYANTWGSGNDRDVDRQLYGVRDLQTFTAAMRQSVEDLKGRGLRRWWEPDIGGMNIGFDANPVEGQLAVGDNAFYAELTAGVPTLYFAPGDFYSYNRTSNFHIFTVATLARAWIDSKGYATDYGYRANASSTPGAGNAIFAGGLVVGYDGVPVADEIRLGTAAFRLKYDVSGDIFLYPNDATSWFTYDLSAQAWFITAASASVTRYTSAGVNVFKGLYVGDGTTAPTDDWVVAAGGIQSLGSMLTPTLNVGGMTNPGVGNAIFLNSLQAGYTTAGRGTDTITVGDANFGFDFEAGSFPRVYFAADGYLSYVRSTPFLEIVVGGTTMAQILSGSNTIQPGADSTTQLGSSVRRWQEVHSTVSRVHSTTLVFPGATANLGRRALNNTIVAAGTTLAAGGLDTGDSRWNVSSVTRPVVGTYSVVLTSALPTLTGQVIAMAKAAGNRASGYMNSATSAIIYTTNSAGAAVDDKSQFICIGGGNHT